MRGANSVPGRVFFTRAKLAALSGKSLRRLRRLAVLFWFSPESRWPCAVFLERNPPSRRNENLRFIHTRREQHQHDRRFHVGAVAGMFGDWHSWIRAAL